VEIRDGLPLPALLAERVAADADPARLGWLDRLPRIVADVARRWELDLGDPFQPGGQCSWVAPARTATGERLVLKIGWLHPEATHEAQGLRFWGGNGSVRVYADELLADSVALLLERCDPGTQLAGLPEPDQDDVVCAILGRLWREPPAGQEFRSLAAMCRQWAAEFETANAARTVALDPGLVRAGIELFCSLPASADRQVLLATDLHAQNILAAEREPWLAIDPKPHIGDPAYDALQHMINCERLIDDPAGLVRRLADLLQLDPQRLQLWLFARCVQGLPERPQLASVAARLAP